MQRNYSSISIYNNCSRVVTLHGLRECSLHCQDIFQARPPRAFAYRFIFKPPKNTLTVRCQGIQKNTDFKKTHSISGVNISYISFYLNFVFVFCKTTGGGRCPACPHEESRDSVQGKINFCSIFIPRPFFLSFIPFLPYLLSFLLCSFHNLFISSSPPSFRHLLCVRIVLCTSAKECQYFLRARFPCTRAYKHHSHARMRKPCMCDWMERRLFNDATFNCIVFLAADSNIFLTLNDWENLSCPV